MEMPGSGAWKCVSIAVTICIDKIGEKDCGIMGSQSHPFKAGSH
jgi:hypothetical protein